MFRQRILEAPLGPAHLQENFPVPFPQTFLGKAGDRGRGEMAAPHCQAVPLQELPTQAPPGLPQPNLCRHLMDQSRILPHPLSAYGVVSWRNSINTDTPWHTTKRKSFSCHGPGISQLSRAPAIPRDPASFQTC